MRSQSPDQGPNQSPLHWKHGVLTAGLPGESPKKLSKHTDIAIFQEEFQLNASIFFFKENICKRGELLKS